MITLTNELGGRTWFRDSDIPYAFGHRNTSGTLDLKDHEFKIQNPLRKRLQTTQNIILQKYVFKI